MKYPINSTNVPKIREWLTRGDHIAVWQNKDLGSPSVGAFAFTPFQRVENESPLPPHWKYGRTPVTVIESMEQFEIIVTP